MIYMIKCHWMISLINIIVATGIDLTRRIIIYLNHFSNHTKQINIHPIKRAYCHHQNQNGLLHFNQNRTNKYPINLSTSLISSSNILNQSILKS